MKLKTFLGKVFVRLSRTESECLFESDVKNDFICNRSYFGTLSFTNVHVACVIFVVEGCLFYDMTPLHVWQPPSQ